MAAHKDCQKKNYNKLFDDICEDIVEKNMSASKALIGRMSFSKFYEMLEEDEFRAKKYARSCILRAERVNDEIIEIADQADQDVLKFKKKDGTEFERQNIEYINRSRLKVDARKWWLSKTNPKKYGEKIDVTTGNEKINENHAINIALEGKIIDLSLNKDKKELDDEI